MPSRDLGTVWRTTFPLTVTALIVLNVASYLSNSNILTATSVTEHVKISSPPRHRNATTHPWTRAGEPMDAWIGDQWIPNQPFYTAEEIRDYFADKSMYFIGDSNARQMFTTLYYILEMKEDEKLGAESMQDAKIIDVNRNSTPYREFCDKPHMILARKVPNTNLPADHSHRTCPSDILATLRNIRATEYNVIVLIFGIHSQIGRCGRDPEQWDNLLDHLKTINYPNLTIVWKTCSNHAISRVSSRLETQATNRNMTQKILEHQKEYLKQSGGTRASLTVLDWASVVEPRSLGGDRIVGNTKAHFGVSARLVFIQMLLHHLKQQDQLKLQLEEIS